MQFLEELHQRYRDQGLVLIGIHTEIGKENAPDIVWEMGLTYPVAVDLDGRTERVYQVDSFPDYHLIDRSGKLRIADLMDHELERAVRALLLE